MCGVAPRISSMTLYPGLDLDLRHHEQRHFVRGKGSTINTFPIGIHYQCLGSDSDMLLVREVAMMIVMDRLTDKPDWHVKVFDDAIADKWIEEGLALPVSQLYDEIVQGHHYAPSGDIQYPSAQTREDVPKKLKTVLDRECLEYCIKELRAKAAYYKKTSLVPTLDATATVVKSDTIVDQELHNDLRAAFGRLRDEKRADPDWHPRTGEVVQNLVHPSLYPLVYGRTRVSKDEVVRFDSWDSAEDTRSTDDLIGKWAGRGDLIRKPDPPLPDPFNIRDVVPPEFWSDNYQWLPTTFRFLGEDSTRVRLTSYVNNLHPAKHLDIYRILERLIEKSLPAWDLCIARYSNSGRHGSGRTKPRFPIPENPDDENDENWTPKYEDFVIPEETPSQDLGPENDLDSKECGEETKEDTNEGEMEGFNEDVEQGEKEQAEEETGEYEYEEEDEVEDPENGDTYSGGYKEVMWMLHREPVQPAVPEFQAWDYESVDHEAKLRLPHGELQVIIKMVTAELTPEKPELPAGGWHVEGQMNEHIVATALYYVEEENVEPTSLQFRMQTSPEQDRFEVGQSNYTWMERVYGTRLGPGRGPCLQNYGSVETRAGRLLAFPNVFHHRVSPVRLADPTRPGRRSFVALWLVDPLTPIISTDIVPPQQHSWWAERAFGGAGAADGPFIPRVLAQHVLDSLTKDQTNNNNSDTDEIRRRFPALTAALDHGRGLPTELNEIVRRELGDDMPMTLEEAREHRIKLMNERTTVQDAEKSEWNSVSYSFCEH